jgi:predicted metal-binding membrane protein
MTRARTVAADSQPILPLLLRRDRLPVALGLVGVTALAWLYLVWMAHPMTGMPEMARVALPMIEPWSAADWLAMFLMWAIMMVAMMLPSAAPVILLYDRVRERQEARGASLAATGVFALGYLIAWVLFSLGATTAQWALEHAALLSPMMASASPWLGGGLLIAAALYQWTPLKHACLAHCRSPVAFLGHHWRPGRSGALRMGLHHGLYCVGCCWVLMALLFVVGVMNLLWIALLASFVLLEKIVPQGELFARLGAIVLAGAGVLVILAGQAELAP